MVRRFGVDEAGKGPVFGPMVVAAVACAPKDLPEGIRDSKRLSPTRRQELATQLHDISAIDIAVVYVTPAEIDDPESNLNDLTVAAHGSAVAAVVEDGMAGCADACDTDVDRYAANLLSHVDADISVDARHKADDHDALVAAASIIAKVERDSVLDSLAEDYGAIGSGYPSDQTTRDYLKTYLGDHGEFPPFTRVSWKTCQKIMAEVQQQGLHDF